MLVLSRRIGEKVVVPSCDLTIEILAIEGGKVRLGLAALHDVVAASASSYDSDHQTLRTSCNATSDADRFVGQR